MELSDLEEEEMEQRHTYINNNYKTYQKVSKKQLNEKNENNNENKKDSDNKG